MGHNWSTMPLHSVRLSLRSGTLWARHLLVRWTRWLPRWRKLRMETSDTVPIQVLVINQLLHLITHLSLLLWWHWSERWLIVELIGVYMSIARQWLTHIVTRWRPTWIAGFSDNIAIIVHGNCLAYLLVLTILSSAVAWNGVSRIVDLGLLTDWSASQISVLMLSLLMVSTRMRLPTWRTTWFSIDEIVVSICVDFECIESNVVPCVLLLLMLLQCLPLPVRIVPRIQYVVPTTRPSGLSYFVLLPPYFFSLLCA